MVQYERQTDTDGALMMWRNRVPFFIRLRDFPKEMPLYGELATTLRELKPLKGTVNADWTTRRLQSGEAIVMLDGLDEVSLTQRKAAMDWLTGLLEAPNPPIVIVTARPSAFDDPSFKQQVHQMGFQQSTLHPLGEEMLPYFVTRWHDALNEAPQFTRKSILPVRKRELLQAFKLRADLRHLATTPLMAAMLCALHLSEVRRLPGQLIKLYTRCVQMLLRRDSERAIDSSDLAVELDEKSLESLLARLAHWMLEEEKAEISRTDAERVIGANGLDGKQHVEFLVARSGLLRRVAADEFDFAHRSLQEFLAAAHIVNSHKVRKNFEDHALNSAWHGTLAMVGGWIKFETDGATALQALLTAAIKHLQKANEIHTLALLFWAFLGLRSDRAKQLIQLHLFSMHRGNFTRLLLPSQVSDLTPLAGLNNLSHLYLSSTQVSDLTPLAGLNNLSHLAVDLINLERYETVRRLLKLV